MNNVQLKNTCEWLNGEGILSSLTTNFDVPWKSVITDGSDLDLDYYGNRSGEKYVSHLTENLLDDENKLSVEDTLRLAGIIYRKYKDNWDRAWLALQQEYNPLFNYTGTEERTLTYGEKTDRFTKGSQTNTEDFGSFTETKGEQENIKGQQLDKDTIAKVTNTEGAQKVTDTIAQRTNTKGAETDTINDLAHTDKTDYGKRKRTTENDIYGFDSNGASHADKTTINDDAYIDKVEYGATQRTNVEGQRSDTVGGGVDTHETNQRIDTVEHEDSDEHEYGERTDKEGERIDTTSSKHNSFEEGQRVDTDITEEHVDIDHFEREGNYGIRSSQELLTEELELRVKYNFFDTIIYPHIDKVLVMSYYKDTSRNLF